MKGFTLIELAIVMAIIGILAAVLIPTASSAGVLGPLVFLFLLFFVFWFGCGIISGILMLKWSPRKQTLNIEDIQDLAFEVFCGGFSLFKALQWKHNRDIKTGVKEPFSIKNPFYKG